MEKTASNKARKLIENQIFELFLSKGNQMMRTKNYKNGELYLKARLESVNYTQIMKGFKCQFEHEFKSMGYWKGFLVLK